MKIKLIRHGKSACDFSKRLTSQNYREWVRKYGEEGICDLAPADVQLALSESTLVLTSDLKRAIDSAKTADTIQSDPLYRELDLPHFHVNFLKLTPRIWTVLYRSLWLIGFSKQAETRKQAKKRAAVAAEQLENHAITYGTVALVGHGFFNRYLGRSLKKRGWEMDGNKGSANWTIHTYDKKR
ncbi:phosphoglycerate mutase family protein [Guptibacillus spartinae]|uniref:phosphoglycerate mutase family protein n=1 Tax=Guptibacillus spartinae TaxID=3025679 RepID=UPI0023618695|nr:phosphoglycerate mutase family protein [Pseudalkalibacillus spartinae]